MKKKMTITVKIPKPRNLALISAQIAGLTRTKVIPNKKKAIRKFNMKKEISYYLSTLINTRCLDNRIVFY